MIFIRRRGKPALPVAFCLLLWLFPGLGAAHEPPPAPLTPHPPIPIHFTLTLPGFVTLVIDDAQGRRVRNLLSETPFPAGENTVWWDGSDDIGRIQIDPNKYQMAAKMVMPGGYRVRGLVRPAIDLRYQFTVYNPGQPPWRTDSPASQWLANHTPPSGVLFLPEAATLRSPAGVTPGGQILVCSAVTEGGSGLAWLDENGRKLRGQMWVGGVWTGATHLARDAGPEPAPGVYAYAGAAWAAGAGGGYDGPNSELRLAELLDRDQIGAAPRDARFGRGDDRPLLTPTKPYSGLIPAGQEKLNTPQQDNRYVFPDAKSAELSGLAVYNARLAASLPKMNQLLWVDAARRKILGTVPLPDPRGLAFDAQGRLLALSGARLLRYTLGANPLKMSAPEILIPRGLEDPASITLDSAGNLYISDRGKSNQVKVFNPSGEPLRVIGKAGLPKLGAYDPLLMHQPNGLAIDSRNRLWVAETDAVPKRISVWTVEGKFVNAFYGPMEYGGGGALDTGDKSRYYYSGLEFKLDWDKGTSRPVAIYYQERDDALKLRAEFKPRGPETALSFKGRRYLTDCYNVSPTNAANSAAIYLLRDGAARPVAALGNARDWDLIAALFQKDQNRSLNREELTGAVAAFRSRLPVSLGLEEAVTFAWTDSNDDGKVQPEETVFQKGAASGITVMPDLSFVVASLDGKALRFKPTELTAGGAPRYNLTRGEILATQTRTPQTSGGGQALAGEKGWTILTVPPAPYPAQAALAGVRNGVPLWTYPSLWPGLHPSQSAPLPDHPGELIGTTRLLGNLITPPKSDIGQLWAINGNKGNAYLLTTDGLFVATLFKDCRVASWSAPRAERNMPVNDLSQEEENFWPMLTQTADGSVYLVTGGNGGSIVRVEGLEAIRRLPDSDITVNAAQLEAARIYRDQQEAARRRLERATTLRVVLRSKAPALDGNLSDWNEDDFAPIDDRARAAVTIAGNRLYAAFKTDDSALLNNSADSLPLLFKTGGALDLMIGAVPGGERLLVTQAKGKTVAVLYRPRDPGATSEPVAFSAPQRTIRFDRVEDISAQVELAGSGGNYMFSVPLKVLNLTPTSGQSLKGDMGVLRGNGFQTLQRVYWQNKATSLVSDIPSEAELTPNQWGNWQFKSE